MADLEPIDIPKDMVTFITETNVHAFNLKQHLEVLSKIKDSMIADNIKAKVLSFHLNVMLKDIRKLINDMFEDNEYNQSDSLKELNGIAENAIKKIKKHSEKKGEINK